MSKSKPGFVYEEHVEMGQKLKEARKILLNAQTKILNAYPRGKGRQGKAVRCLGKSLERLDEARSELDALLINEDCPVEEWRGVYYGLDESK